MTRLHVSAQIGWTAEGPATAVLQVRAAEAAGQTVLDERLEVDGADVEDPGALPNGSRPVRLRAAGGPVRLHYTATVDLAEAHADGTDQLPSFGDLDFDLLPWTLPSRYCPADVLGPTAEVLFGDAPRTAALLEQVRAWVHDHVAYVSGSSDVHTAADETLLRRTGVCRDLAHLTATLLRSLDVPARLVGAYALDLEPPDFHAVVEAHDGTGWRLLDATELAPVDTLVRIATGRDAADIAWGTTEGPLQLDHLEVAVTAADEG
ncbi:transglutaminase family protein [Egicoccus sp. AB-alg6-2]|uniref:transglutaminase-like domain-containing protein n=1 Tax=Egicoccus sp. AB-alg6-2 TaxID=3242692 RepID=UPI00359D20ED